MNDPAMQDRVKAPAIGLIVTGVIGVLLYGSSVFTEQVMAAILRAVKAPEKDIQRALDSLHPFGEWFDYAQIAVGLAVSLFVIYGGMQMLKLRSFGIVLAAAILTLLPCVGPCCCVGIPIGIWALVVISKPEVKAAFTP
jgi:hypothetical protein